VGDDNIFGRGNEIPFDFFMKKGNFDKMNVSGIDRDQRNSENRGSNIVNLSNWRNGGKAGAKFSRQRNGDRL
jgi:hypothetical protein